MPHNNTSNMYVLELLAIYKMELIQEHNQGSEKPELYKTVECESCIPCQPHFCLTLTVYKIFFTYKYAMINSGTQFGAIYYLFVY
jgi:hypothetical protein